MIINFYFPSLGPLLTNGWIKDLVKDLVKDMEVDSVFFNYYSDIHWTATL